MEANMTATPPATKATTVPPELAGARWKRNELDLLPAAMSVESAALYSGLGRTMLYELIADGRLASIKIGKRRLVRREAIDKLLAESEG